MKVLQTAIIAIIAVVSAADAEVVYLERFNASSKRFNPSASDSDYAYFNISETQPANGGDIYQGSGFVQVTSNPFNLTAPQGPYGILDHVKLLAVHKTQWKAAEDGAVEYRARFSAQTFKPSLHPFGDAVTNPNDDLRLGFCGPINIDFDTFVVAFFSASNEALWAFYERLPFGKNTGDLGDYQPLPNVKRIADRTPDQIHDVRIQYDRANKMLRYYVGDEVVLSVDKIGVLSADSDVKVIRKDAGTAMVVDPAGFNTGVGCFTLLDMADPLNASVDRGLVQVSSPVSKKHFPSRWIDSKSQESNRMFGQGTQITMHEIEVTTFGCDDGVCLKP